MEGQVGQYAGEASEGGLLERPRVVTFARAGLMRRRGRVQLEVEKEVEREAGRQLVCTMLVRIPALEAELWH